MSGSRSGADLAPDTETTDAGSGDAPLGDHLANAPRSLDGRPARQLSDLPDWQYALMEFHKLYRFGSAGGSDRIRKHMRAVRERLSRAIASDPPLRFQAPAGKPVTAHLSRALDTGIGTQMDLPVRSIAKIAPHLVWQWGYERMPRNLDKKYAFAELLGPNGPVLCEDVIIGLVLFAPRCTYPSHSHDGIEESYVILSGAISENHAGVFVPGSLILNMANHEHAITTQQREPALLGYAWVGAPDKLAHPHMTFSRKRKA
jgi:dimethylpropiothetin dethiomethylase